MRIFIYLLVLLVHFLAGCDDSLLYVNRESFSKIAMLQIQVASDTYSTKSVNFSNELPAGSSIGLFLHNVDELEMVQTDVRNVSFTVSDTNGGQNWVPSREIYLNKEFCNVYAYYPYNEFVTDISAIPVSVEQQFDYLYSGDDVQVNNENNQAQIKMKHAMSVMSITVQRGSYSGVGRISKLGIIGKGIAKTAKLNAISGALYDIGGAFETIYHDCDISMSESGQTIHKLFVPTDVTSNVKISLWIDGKEYYVIAHGAHFEQGYRYEYTLSVNETGLALSDLRVSNWGYNSMGNPILWAGNSRIIFTGNYEGMAFSNSINESSVVIKAMGTNCVPAWSVNLVGEATLEQRLDDKFRVITLSNINSDIEIEFNGLDPWYSLADGIYGVGVDLLPMPSSEATESCIGVGIVCNSVDQRFMIEKYEATNASYKQSYIDFGATNSSYCYFQWGNSGVTMNSLLGITDYSVYSKVNVSYVSGYLPDYKGNYTTYANGNKLGIPAEWPHEPMLYALSDTRGYKNSQYLLEALSFQTQGSCPTISQLLYTFLSSADALGYTDWAIPACGQLALMYAYKEDINSLLTTIGGTTFAQSNYWSSSERSTTVGMAASFLTGCVDGNAKTTETDRVRLIRSL